MLNEDGILLSMDFTEVRNKIIGKSWIFGIFSSNFNWTTTFIMLVNVITMIIYYRYSNNRLNQMGNIARRRNTEINSVIHEIIRLNNLNVAYGMNMMNMNQNNPNSVINPVNNPGPQENIINNLNILDDLNNYEIHEGENLEIRNIEHNLPLLDEANIINNIAQNFMNNNIGNLNNNNQENNVNINPNIGSNNDHLINQENNDDVNPDNNDI